MRITELFETTIKIGDQVSFKKSTGRGQGGIARVVSIKGNKVELSQGAGTANISDLKVINIPGDKGVAALSTYDLKRGSIREAEMKGTIEVTQRGPNEFLVSTKETSGPILGAIYHVYDIMRNKKGLKIQMRSGKVLKADPYTALRLMDTRPNGLVFVFKDPTGAEEILQAAIEKAKQKVEKAAEKHAAWKAGAAQRKKDDAKYYADQRKADLAKYEKEYGKGTWNRVKYRQEGGDDGYSYVVRVDGRAVMNGLSKRSAEYEKLRQVDDIAKKEKLGKYAGK